jgi:hypothetical protein
MEVTSNEYFYAKAKLTLTDERSFLLQLSVPWKISILISITSSLAIGWIAKAVIFSHIFTTKIKEQPINALILIEQVSILPTNLLF